MVLSTYSTGNERLYCSNIGLYDLEARCEYIDSNTKNEDKLFPGQMYLLNHYSMQKYSFSKASPLNLVHQLTPRVTWELWKNFCKNDVLQ